MRGAPSDTGLLVKQIEDLIAQGGKFMPFWGWHDDHRDADGTEAYLPAVQQVRAEFYGLLDLLDGTRCLQLGLGISGASHEVWACRFKHVVTIDSRVSIVDTVKYLGHRTDDLESISLAQYHGPYDFLFIDAGHTYQNVGNDHYTYGNMVRPGGIIAFHDALPREGYPEVEVWRYVKGVGAQVIGDEVGVAWLRR